MDAFSKQCQCFNCADCFSRNPIFSLLSHEELDIMNNKRVEVSFKKDEIIYKQGMPLTHLVVLRNGIGKIYIEGSKGKSLILSYTKPFEMNGGIGIFLDQIHHSSLVATSDCDTCYIDIQSFNEVSRGNAKFMEAFLRYHSDKIRQTYYQFTVLTQKNMEARMAEAILYLSKTVFCNTIIKGISKQDLADFTAMSRESTIRVLKDFKDEGFIDLDRQDIKVIHAESLQKIASLG
jgi:CRP/FNR family transcriptional regulator